MDGNDGLVRAHLAQLWPRGPFPPTPERNLYVESVWAANEAARYFTRYGRHAPAEQAYQALADHFPETQVAQRALDAIAALRENPVTASLDAIEHHARIQKQMKPNFDKEALVNHIIDNADFPPLRQALLERKQREPQ